MARKISPLAPLALYNLVSAALWGYILYNVATLYPKVGQPEFFARTKNTTTYIQCGAIIEIFNSMFGIVRAPLFTTVAQVASRLLVVIGIFQLVPEAPAAHNTVYITLLIAWSITEVVRYFFYYCNLVLASGAPKLLILLRYNLFWVLYPMGVTSELLIIYSSLTFAESSFSENYKWFLIGCMLTYIPGFPILFTHMISQRKKVMKSLRNGNSKKKN